MDKFSESREDREIKYTRLLEEFRTGNQTAKDFCQSKGTCYKTFLRAAKRQCFDVRSRGWKRGQHPASRGQLSPTSPSKHGVYSFIQTGIVPCGNCLWRGECNYFQKDSSCKVLINFQELKMEELMSLPHIKTEDGPLCQLAVREMCLQELILRYTSKVGLFRKMKDGGIGMQHVMNQYWCSVNSLARVLDRLGLSPLARKQLGIGAGGGFNLAQAIMDSEE